MQCTIYKWLLGIWLVDTVVARHILNGEEDSGNTEVRNGRVQLHRQPFYNSPHFSYNSFMSSVRARRRPQSPGRRNLVEQETSSNDHQQQFNNQYSNYFTNDHLQNQQNLNVYSAVRLHGALEARAKAEPGSNTLVPTTQYNSNYFQHPPLLLHQQEFSRRPADRQRRREDAAPRVDGESYERDDELARFSLYNSYFDNEHSIKALNSMKCVTPTGSPGFCSTFRGCVPSFFTAEGDLEAPALAELISTSIGYCTTNISHHYIREQRDHFFSREERRYNSVANRIICCPGIAPVRDPNHDPDKIFNDYLESQKRKTSTTASPVQPESENTMNGSSNSSLETKEPETPVEGSESIQNPSGSLPEHGSDTGMVHDGEDESSNHDGSQSSAQESSPVPAESAGSEGVTASMSEEPSHPTSDKPMSDPVPEVPQSSEDSIATSYPDHIEVTSEGSVMSQSPVSDSSSMVKEPQESQSSSDDMMKPEQPQSSTEEATVNYPSEQPTEKPTMAKPEQSSPMDSDSEQTDASSHEPEFSPTSSSPLPPMEESSNNENSQPSQDEVEPTTDVSPASSVSTVAPPETEPQPNPGKLPDSNLTKIYPEPVSGVNGKFTLPGALYIFSSSAENNNDPKPVHPPAGDEAIVGSKPIIIVTKPMPGMMMPSFEMPAMPSFPSDFPPMGSEESLPPPVDDSSLELQQIKPRPSYSPPVQSSPSPIQSTVSQHPESSSSPTSSNVETTQSSVSESNPPNNSQPNESDISVPITTTIDPQQQPQEENVDESSHPPPPSSSSTDTTTQEAIISPGGNMQQQDESDSSIITTVQPQQPAVTGQESIPPSITAATTNAPSFDDEENDALTILPIQDTASEKSGSTTEIPTESLMTTLKSKPAENEMVGGEGQSQQQQQQQGLPGAGVNEITTSSPINPQDVEITTLSPSPNSQEAVETTTIAAATTPSQDSNESEESSEERVTGSGVDDIQRTTTLSPDDDTHNDFNTFQTTTVADPNVAHDGQNEEVLPETMGNVPVVDQQTVPPSESLVTATQSTVSDISIPSSESGSVVSSPVHDQPMEVAEGEDQVSETIQPFPVSSPSTPVGGESEQQIFPEGVVTNPPPSELPQQPFPDTEGDQQRPVSDAADTTTAVPVSIGDQQQPTDQPLPVSETNAPSDSSQASNVGESAELPTTNSPVNMEQDNKVSEGVHSAVGGDTTINPNESDHRPSSDEADVPSGDGTSISPIDESSPGSGSTAIPDGSQSGTDGIDSVGSGTESNLPGSGSNNAEPSPDKANSDSSGTESSIISDPATSTDGINTGDHSASTQTPSTGPPESITEASNPSTSEDSSVPIHDDSSSPNNSDNELSTSSSSTVELSSTAAPAAGGVTETETISQETVPSISADSAQDAPSMSESPEQSDSSVSPVNVQDPQPIVSTTEVSPDVSTTDPITSDNSSSSFVPPYPGMIMLPSSSTAEPMKPSILNEDPPFQILKACKFQSYFRSMMEDDMDFSYRHYPWLATIVGGTRPFSSGTLITDRHILTASHFLSNITVSDVFNMRIHVGYRTSYTGNTEGPYAVRKVKKVIRHKGFSFEKLYNDIAVLVLDRPVRFSEDIYPVCISSSREGYADGTAEAFETGWIEDPRTYTISQHHNYVDPHIQKYFSFGYKNITWRLQEASQRVRTNQECQSNYGFLEKNGIAVTDSMVCAGSGDTRSCAFRGNSGAPLFIRNGDDKMTEQVGIVSWGIGCGHFPFVFTRVESFLPWLDRVVYNSR